MSAAIAWRQPLFNEDNNAARLVHAESDGLPGVIVDRYSDTLVVQILSAGAELWRESIFDALAGATGCARIFERSDLEVRTLEGLPPRNGPVRGQGPSELIIAEHGLKYVVDVAAGQKTGFYLDQRDNRRRIEAIAGGCDVLDCFGYTGGFALNALRGGARSVLSVDSSRDAVRTAERNAELNGIVGGRSWLPLRRLTIDSTTGRRGAAIPDTHGVRPTSRAATARRDIAGIADDQLARREEPDVSLLRWALLRDLRDGGVDRGRGHLRRGHPQRGQRRDREAGDGQVVEAGDREVSGTTRPAS